MKDGLSLFPALGAEAAQARAQVGQTLAMGLVPLGLVIFLTAAGAPDWPGPGLWAGTVLLLGGMGLLAALWSRSGHHHLRGFSTVHYLIRYLFIVLCPLLLWFVFGGLVVELAGMGPPLFLALILLIHPIGRIVAEQVAPDPQQTPRLEMARITCQQLQMVFSVFALIGILSGAVQDAHKDYPTDPTVILLLLWLLAMVALLAGMVLWGAHWMRLFGRPAPPQPLDDEAPPPAPPRYGSNRF